MYVCKSSSLDSEIQQLYLSTDWLLAYQSKMELFLSEWFEPSVALSRMVVESDSKRFDNITYQWQIQQYSVVLLDSTNAYMLYYKQGKKFQNVVTAYLYVIQ